MSSYEIPYALSVSDLTLENHDSMTVEVFVCPGPKFCKPQINVETGDMILVTKGKANYKGDDPKKFYQALVKNGIKFVPCPLQENTMIPEGQDHIKNVWKYLQEDHEDEYNTLQQSLPEDRKLDYLFVYPEKCMDGFTGYSTVPHQKVKISKTASEDSNIRPTKFKDGKGNVKSIDGKKSSTVSADADKYSKSDFRAQDHLHSLLDEAKSDFNFYISNFKYDDKWEQFCPRNCPDRCKGLYNIYKVQVCKYDLKCTREFCAFNHSKGYAKKKLLDKISQLESLISLPTADKRSKSGKEKTTKVSAPKVIKKSDLKSLTKKGSNPSSEVSELSTELLAEEVAEYTLKESC